MTRQKLKEKCIKLREIERLSYKEIIEQTGVSKSTLSYWLNSKPLSNDEKRARRQQRDKNRRLVKENELEKLISKHYKSINIDNLTRDQKGRIAESAVLFRLCLHEFTAFKSPFDGDKIDWLIRSPTGKLLKLQVKFASRGEHGQPTIKLRCTSGHNKCTQYRDGDFDFIVGYDLLTDTAYIFSWDEVKEHTTTISTRDDAAEAWDKLIT
jgi:transcriptional regulator with XRE-family HTH domain